MAANVMLVSKIFKRILRSESPDEWKEVSIDLSNANLWIECPYHRKYGIGDIGIVVNNVNVATKNELEETAANFNQQIATVVARTEAVEKIQSNLSSKHTEILAEIKRLPEIIKIELVKEALSEMVADMVREEVRKAMSGEE